MDRVAALRGKPIKLGAGPAATTQTEVKKTEEPADKPYKRKTKAFKQVNYNKMHQAVFPDMRVPIYMSKQNGKKNRAGINLASRAGFTSSDPADDVPIMSTQTPMPGGTAVITTTDPLKKVIWGPISRIEVSDQAKDLVKQLRQAAKTAVAAKKANATKKAKAGCRNGKDKKEESDTESEGTSKPVKSPEHDESTIIVGKENEAAAANTIADNDATTNTVSVAETGLTTGSMGDLPTRGFLIAPPGTPPDTAFLRELSAAALSMPTLPTMHYIADTKLVELYRLQYVKDPEAFEQETLDIKQGLVEAKVNRGGIPMLLREEYTVELASREGAEMTEKWYNGQGKNREFPGLRSRGNNLIIQTTAGALKMRGGEIEEEVSPVIAGSSKIITNEELIEEAPLVLPPPSVSEEPTTTEAVKEEKKPNVKAEHGEKKYTLRQLKEVLRQMNLNDHVAKINTYGTVRLQSSVRREATDFGEKRRIKTWIEIEEVYEVPKSQNLTIKDLIDGAIYAEDSDMDSDVNSGSEWEDETDSDYSAVDSTTDGEADEKETRRNKKKAAKGNKKSTKGKGKKTTKSKKKSKKSGYTPDDDESSSSSSGSSSSSDSESSNNSIDAVLPDADETTAESLFRSLSQLEGTVDADTISRLTTDLGTLIAGLRVQGMLDEDNDEDAAERGGAW